MKIYGLKKISGRRVFIGYLGIGGTGLFTIKHMIDNMDSVERVAIIETIYLPPLITYNEGRLYYPIELYKSGENLILKVENLPPGSRGNKVVKNLIRFLKRIGVEEYIVIGGLTKNLREGESDEYRVVYNKYWRNKVPGKEAPKNLRIFGPLAATLLYTELEKVPALGILAYSDDNVMDPMAVSYAVRAINSIFGFNLPIDSLKEAAKEVRDMMRELEELVEKGKNIYT